MKKLALILGSIAINAIAVASPLVKCAQGHAAIVARASKGFEVKQLDNAAAGVQLTTVIAPDGSSMTLMTAPLKVMDKFKKFPLEPLGVQCLGPKDEVVEAFVMYTEPRPTVGGPSSL